MKTFKRVIALLLVSCLLFCAAPSAFAAESTGSAAAETEEEDILDNPIFTGAIKDIVVAFVQSFTEIFNRYVEIIKALISSIELPETPLLPEAPDAGGETDDPAAEEQPSDSEVEIQPAA